MVYPSRWSSWNPITTFGSRFQSHAHALILLCRILPPEQMIQTFAWHLIYFECSIYMLLHYMRIHRCCGHVTRKGVHYTNPTVLRTHLYIHTRVCVCVWERVYAYIVLQRSHEASIVQHGSANGWWIRERNEIQRKIYELVACTIRNPYNTSSTRAHKPCRRVLW